MTECFFRALGQWDDEFPYARDLWIPAFAGMTECFFRALGQWDDEFPHARELWIPAFAGMTECLNEDSRLRGNDVAGLRGFLATVHIRRITIWAEIL